jgi:hypothetical protein
VSGGGVVTAVRDPPGVVRHEDKRVEHETDSVVDALRGRERLVTALVAENPDAGTDETRSDLVGEEERGSGGPVRRRGEVAAGSAG